MSQRLFICVFRGGKNDQIHQQVHGASTVSKVNFTARVACATEQMCGAVASMWDGQAHARHSPMLVEHKCSLCESAFPFAVDVVCARVVCMCVVFMCMRMFNCMNAGACKFPQ